MTESIDRLNTVGIVFLNVAFIAVCGISAFAADTPSKDARKTLFLAIEQNTPHVPYRYDVLSEALMQLTHQGFNVVLSEESLGKLGLRLEEGKLKGEGISIAVVSDPASVATRKSSEARDNPSLVVQVTWKAGEEYTTSSSFGTFKMTHYLPRSVVTWWENGKRIWSDTIDWPVVSSIYTGNGPSMEDDIMAPTRRYFAAFRERAKAAGSRR